MEYPNSSWIDLLNTDKRTGVLLSPTDERAERIGQMFARYGTLIQRYIASQIRTTDEAADLTQEVFARFLNSPQSNSDTPKAFLFQIATNLLRDRARRRRSRHTDLHIPFDDDFIQGIGTEPSRVIDTERQLKQVETVILNLPAKCRAVFILSRFEGHSYQQIADRLDISVAMVQKHISKALLRLRQGVEQNNE